MSINKKFGLIFLVLVVLPIIIFVYLLSSVYYSNNRILFSILSLISIVSCVYIFYKNYTTKINNIFWYIIVTIFGLSTLFLWYTLNSLSHFGF